VREGEGDVDGRLCLFHIFHSGIPREPAGRAEVKAALPTLPDRAGKQELCSLVGIEHCLPRSSPGKGGAPVGSIMHRILALGRLAAQLDDGKHELLEPSRATLWLAGDIVGCCSIRSRRVDRPRNRADADKCQNSQRAAKPDHSLCRCQAQSMKSNFDRGYPSFYPSPRPLVSRLQPPPRVKIQPAPRSEGANPWSPDHRVAGGR
jgi:hypothetical protein